MTFEYVTRTPPEGGEAQEMLAVSGASARLTPASVPDEGGMIFSVWCQASTAGQITIGAGDAFENVNVSTDWTRVFAQFDSAPENVTITVGEITVYLYKAQLEAGTRATDWRPAPEDTDKDISDVREAIYTESGQLRSDIERYMALDDSRGFVIRLKDKDTGEDIGMWENVISETSYQIINSNMGIVAFDVTKDTCTPQKLAFTRNRKKMVAKADGRGGVVFVVEPFDDE